MFNVPETLKTESEMLKQGIIPRPRMAILVNSYKCNQNCEFCFHKPYNDGYCMPTHSLFTLIDHLALFGVKAIDFCGGGEPLCAPDMDKVFEYIHSKGLKQCLITNGSLLAGDMMKKIIDYGTFVRISLDTVDREMYKKIHGVDMLPIVLENIKNAVDYKAKTKSNCDISVKVSLFKGQTLKSIQAVFDYFKNVPITSIQVKHLWDSDGNYLNKDISKEQLGNMEAHGTQIIRKMRYAKYMNERCWISPVQTTIDARGDVFICCYYQNRDNDHRIGNIYANQFNEIWGSALHREKLSKIKITDCLKHDCRFQKYMNCITKHLNIGDWEFV